MNFCPEICQVYFSIKKAAVQDIFQVFLIKILKLTDLSDILIMIEGKYPVNYPDIADREAEKRNEKR